MDAEPTQEYASQRPQLPEVVVSQPWDLTRAHNKPEITIGDPIYDPDPTLNIDWLLSYDYKEIAHMDLDEWEYAKRWEAHPILPFLYLGPSVMAKNKDFLREKHITLSVGITIGESSLRLLKPALQAAADLGIMNQSLVANSMSEMISLFNKAKFSK
jgi:hypothetical protein